MAKDRAKHTILPPSKFGLVQITRQRVRPEMIVPVLESCPTCNGTGQIKSSMVLMDEIENNLNYLIQDQNENRLSLVVHPFIYSFLTKGFLNSIQMKWFFKYKTWIKVSEDKDYAIMKFQFFNKNGDLIKK
jgi:ribonuclease G